jgi:hypothetical protein
MRTVPQYRQWEKEPEMLSGDVSFKLKTGKSGLLKLYATANRSSLTTLEESLMEPGSTYPYKLMNDNYFANASWTGEDPQELDPDHRFFLYE